MSQCRFRSLNTLAPRSTLQQSIVPHAIQWYTGSSERRRRRRRFSRRCSGKGIDTLSPDLKEIALNGYQFDDDDDDDDDDEGDDEARRRGRAASAERARRQAEEVDDEDDEDDEDDHHGHNHGPRGRGGRGGRGGSTCGRIEEIIVGEDRMIQFSGLPHQVPAVAVAVVVVVVVFTAGGRAWC